jgi:hypothetical protein
LNGPDQTGQAEFFGTQREYLVGEIKLFGGCDPKQRLNIRACQCFFRQFIFYNIDEDKLAYLLSFRGGNTGRIQCFN